MQGFKKVLPQVLLSSLKVFLKDSFLEGTQESRQRLMSLADLPTLHPGFSKVKSNEGFCTLDIVLHHVCPALNAQAPTWRLNAEGKETQARPDTSMCLVEGPNPASRVHKELLTVHLKKCGCI